MAHVPFSLNLLLYWKVRSVCAILTLLISSLTFDSCLRMFANPLQFRILGTTPSTKECIVGAMVRDDKNVYSKQLVDIDATTIDQSSIYANGVMRNQVVNLFSYIRTFSSPLIYFIKTFLSWRSYFLSHWLHSRLDLLVQTDS